MAFARVRRDLVYMGGYTAETAVADMPLVKAVKQCPGFAGIIRPVFGLLEQHLMIFPHRVLVATLLLGIGFVPIAWGQPATQSSGGLSLALKSAVVMNPAATEQI